MIAPDARDLEMAKKWERELENRTGINFDPEGFDMLVELIARVRAEERALIVAWLRRGDSRWVDSVERNWRASAADILERREHER